MGLKGKITFEREVKCHGDIFHDFFRHKPHDLASVSPSQTQGCALHEGEHFGAVGSISVWNYTLDVEGKPAMTVKTVIEAIDEEKKTITFNAIEGDVLEPYRSFRATLQIDTSGDDQHLVKWTFDYEKSSEDIGEPISYLKWFIDVTKDIEAHHASAK